MKNKYIKLFEDIDWKEWDWEEEKDYLNEINIEKLKNYEILYNNWYECEIIANALIEMGFDVYDYDNLHTDYNDWKKFIYDDISNYWVQSKNNKIKKYRFSFDDFYKIIKEYE